LTTKGDLKRQAELAFAMGRHVLTDLAAAFGCEESSRAAHGQERLSPEQYDDLRQSLVSRGFLFGANRLLPAEFARCRRL
jgi:hypothetical protein